MKRRLLFLCSVLLALSVSGVAGATTYQWSLGDLSDLDHSYYYMWGEDDWALSEGETIVSASVTFNDIRNYDGGGNDLWLSLLDTALDGVSWGYDGAADGSYFESGSYTGTQITLEHWEDLSAGAQDITYYFDTDEIGALVSYLENDSVFGLGFDPDCHFYNNGVSFSVETSSCPPVPEPTTMLLLGCGLAGLGFVRRKKD